MADETTGTKGWAQFAESKEDVDQQIDDGPPPLLFSVFDHIAHKDNISVYQRLQEFVWEAQLADRLGFDYYFTAEHHFGKNFSLSHSQSISLATIAQNTERIRFGPMGYTVALNEPLRTAEETLVLDHMSNGRLEVGLTRGITPHELITYGIRNEEGAPRFREGLEFLIKAWTQHERFSFNGQFYKYYDVELPWEPVQQPHPPIWIPSFTPANAKEWGRRGYGTAGISWLGHEPLRETFAAYQEGWKTSGRRTSEQRLGYLCHIIVADTDKEGKELALEHFPPTIDLFDYLDVQRNYWIGDTEMKRTTQGVRNLYRQIRQYDHFDENLMVLSGSPPRIAEQIQRLRESLPVNVIFGEFSFGMLPWETVKHSLELFATEVIPQLRQAATPASG